MTWQRDIPVFSVAFLIGCGAEVVEDRDPPVLPPTAAPEVEECTAPLLVPTGNAWVGGMRWRAGKLEPLECDESDGTVGIRLTVPDFFLDQDEVTNDCYRRCVEAGACSPPLPVPTPPDAEPVPPWDDSSMRQVPTQQVTEAMAETFCAWRGGRLPTLAEFMRAEHDNAVAVVNLALTDLWLACAQEPKPDECGEIWNHVYSWPSPVRSWPLDQGPFGHFDLAGSVVELTSTRLAATADEFDALCEIPFDSNDPGSFGSGEPVGFATAGNLLTPPTEGGTVGWAVHGSGEGGAGVEGGLRCAYDPL